MRIPARLLAVVLTGSLATAAWASPDLGSEAQRADGKQLYDKYCAQCHGDTGDGEGYATPRVKPKPRDFTSGKYKFRTTPGGKLPTDDDIRAVIKDGVPYTSMPGWPILNDQQIDNIIYYIKTFYDGYDDPQNHAPPIEVGQPLTSNSESIERGKQVYVEQGCGACHGELGRGDGMSAPTLVDDAGNHIRPADMTQRWTFRGGPTREDMFITFSTGLTGTPMPSYYDALEVEDRWHLVNYMESLGESDTPDYANLLLVAPSDDELDLTRGEELFAGATQARFPLVGQIIERGRNFYPSATSIEVKAVANRREIAFMLRWHDMRAETDGTNAPNLEVPPWDEDQAAAPAASEDDAGDLDDWGDWGDDSGGEAAEEETEDDFWGDEEGGDEAAAAGEAFSDAVALQFPSQLPSGIRKPYFIFGDTQSPVDLWFRDLAAPDGLASQFVGRGSASIEPSEADDIETVATFDRGEWTVIFKRELKGRGGVSFQQDLYVPLSFSVWDGFNRERGNKRALSPWFYAYVEPRDQPSKVAPMVRAGLVTLFLEILVIFLIRWRSRQQPADTAQVAQTTAS